MHLNRFQTCVDHVLNYMRIASTHHVNVQSSYKKHILELGPQRYTPPPGLGLEKIGEWLVWTIWWCIYKLLYFTAVCIYTTTSSTPAISLFFLGPNPVVVYIFGVPT